MNAQLKNDLENFKEILNHTVEVAQHHFDRQETLPPGRFIPDIPMADLPARGIGAHLPRWIILKIILPTNSPTAQALVILDLLRAVLHQPLSLEIGWSALTIKMPAEATIQLLHRSNVRPFISSKNFLDLDQEYFRIICNRRNTCQFYKPCPSAGNG